MRAPRWLTDPVLGLERNGQLDQLAGRLRPLAERAGQGRSGEVLRGEWLGHALHPLLTDFPLGCFVGSGLLDLFGGASSRAASQRLVGLGLLSIGGAAVTGLADWSAGTSDERVRRVGAVHAALNVTMAATYGASWLLRRGGRHGLGVTVGMLGGGLGWVSGYLGGHLSFNLAHGTGDRGLRETFIPAAPS